MYDGMQASRIIFCEGPWLSRNHYFNWLPMRPVKGELIEIELQQSLDFIVNRGVFVLPVGGRTCKVGATFDNYNLDWSVTEEAKEKLLTRVKNLLKIPFKVTGQTAGIRPASEDRRPFIGIHPEFEPLAIFNGLGTKGVSLAPYLIHRFFEYLEKGEPLVPEVSISRYFSLYYSKN
jgi:glycine/D-amino acid oxidase-like deaminating enzyme